MRVKRSSQRGSSQVISVMLVASISLAIALGVLREVRSAMSCGSQRIAALLVADTPPGRIGGLCRAAATPSPRGGSESVILVAGGKKGPPDFLDGAAEKLKRLKEAVESQQRSWLEGAVKRSRERWSAINEEAKELVDPVRKALAEEGRDGMSPDVRLPSLTDSELRKRKKSAERLLEEMEAGWTEDVRDLGADAPFHELSQNKGSVEAVIRLTSKALRNRGLE